MISTSPAAPSAAGATALAACNRYNRTALCWNTKLTVTVLKKKVVVGRLYGTITQSIKLNTKNRAFSESFALKTDRIVGNAGGIRANVAASCGTGCKARTKGLSGTLVAGRTIKGTVSYADGTRRVHAARTTYRMTLVKAGYTPGVPTWRSPIDFRCDNLLKGQKAGCVFPRFTPSITSLRSLRFIAPNIRKWQGRGAPKTLHRNSHLTNGNRRAVCGKAKLPKGWKAPKGWPTPLSDPKNKPSCDEYAFAGTNQGGSRAGNGYGWVPKRENDSQGAQLKNFYYAHRVLDATSSKARGDAFNVAM
ncbi:NucA/NucB deoxyribonuclease domain-containing protein [Actinomadura spongiicola]|uniref:NucA/NucB deoxyribonuclease domain-containing protein n=1 Tax=Actinomadura spongiicola TaxID=2303421 RepID=UPI001314B209|nr:NucA/NucB deoxyribonuclease domain-containing protein [Actinomadura spongiicola]